MSNRERILEASLELFNRHGVRKITTNHIAAHIGISPGNLYYHFRNKEEIIRELFPRIEAAAHATMPLPEGRPIAAAELARYHIAGLQTLWDYRFFFRDLSELVSRDPLLAERVRELQRWLVGRFVALFQRLIDQKHMRLRGFESDLRRLATNAVIVWTSWNNYVAMARGSPQLTTRDVVEGSLHGLLVIAPFLTPRFVERVRANILQWAEAHGAAFAASP